MIGLVAAGGGGAGGAYPPARRVWPNEMTDQQAREQAREFVEKLAVPEAAEPPPCPICDRGHPLETRCAHSTDRRPKAAGLRE